jgi:hypothetical protein
VSSSGATAPIPGASVARGDEPGRPAGSLPHHGEPPGKARSPLSLHSVGKEDALGQELVHPMGEDLAPRLGTALGFRVKDSKRSCT